MKLLFLLSLWLALWLAPGESSAQTPDESRGLPAHFAADWARDSLGCNGYRAAHCPALLSKKRLRGRSSAAIERLLGPPNVQEGQGYGGVVIYSLACTDLAAISSSAARRTGTGPPPGQLLSRESTRLLILEFKRGKCKKVHLLVS